MSMQGLKSSVAAEFYIFEIYWVGLFNHIREARISFSGPFFKGFYLFIFRERRREREREEKCLGVVLTCVAQLVGQCSTKQKVAGSIPSKGTCF